MALAPVRSDWTRFREELAALRKTWSGLLAIGITQIVLGLIALALPWVFTLGTMLFFGLLLLVAGIVDIGDDPIALIKQVHVGKGLPDDPKAALPAAIKNNARFHAAELSKRSEILKDFIGSGRVQVTAGVYSLTTGDIEWLPETKKKPAPVKD